MDDLKPYVSVLLIILVMFSIVFMKMEVRRLSYVLYKVRKELKLKEDDYQFKKIQYAKRMRPDRLRYLALTKLTMGEAKRGQIIQLSGEKLVVPQ